MAETGLAAAEGGTRSLDQLSRLVQHGCGYRESEGLGGLEVDDQVELGGLLHRHVRGIGALEDPVGIRWATRRNSADPVRPVGNRGARVGKDSGLRATTGRRCALANSTIRPTSPAKSGDPLTRSASAWSPTAISKAAARSAAVDNARRHQLHAEQLGGLLHLLKTRR